MIEEHENEPSHQPAEEADPELDAAIDALESPEDQLDSRRVWLWLAAGGLVVLVGFLLVFWPVMRGRLDAVKKVDDAQAFLTQAESTMSSIDKTVTTQLSPDAAPAIPSIAAQIIVARRELAQADALLGEAAPHLTEDELHRVQLLQAAIKARRTMIDLAPGILITSTKAVQAKTLGDQAWKLTTRASAAEVDAASRYRNGTAPDVEAASLAATTIRDQLTDARGLYSQAASAFPDAGFERYVAYVDLRKQEAALLGTAAEAWLGNDMPLAQKTFASYETAIAQSSLALQKLPYAPGTATGTAFKKLAGHSADAYTKAKKQAEDADKALKSGS